MNSDASTWFMCLTISTISVLTSFIPKHFVLRIYGICMGLAAGALCAVLFADLFPELLEKFIHKVEGKTHDSMLEQARLYSGLILAGVFFGGLVEAVVHFFMPEDHCHGSAAGHCKHGQEHEHSKCLEEKESSNHGHGHGHSHDRCDSPDHRHSHNDGHSHCHGHQHEEKPNKIELKSTTDVENQSTDASFEYKKKEPFSLKHWFSELSYIPRHVWLYTICRLLHVISDGMVIGLTRQWIIVIGLLAHELPDCLGSYGFYINYKVSKSHSIFLLISSCVGFFIGNSLVYMIKDEMDTFELYFISIIIGMFMYVVFLIILPETMNFKDSKDAFFRFLTFIISLVLISTLIYAFHTHGEHDHHHSGQSHGHNHDGDVHDHHGHDHHEHDHGH